MIKERRREVRENAAWWLQNGNEKRPVFHLMLFLVEAVLYEGAGDGCENRPLVSNRL